MKHRSVRAAAVGSMTLALLALSAGAASAHVTVSPDAAAAESSVVLTFNVPNERADATTTQVEIDLPTDHDLGEVSVGQKHGWSVDIRSTTSSMVASSPPSSSPAPSAAPAGAGATPTASMPGMSMDGGSMPGMTPPSSPAEPTESPATASPTASEATNGDQLPVSTVIWTAQDSGAEIQSGRFDQFTLSLGRLPTGVDTLAFKALQTYSNGEVVRWIETSSPGSAEPEHPAPVLRLLPPGTDVDLAARALGMADSAETTATAMPGMQMSGHSKDMGGMDMGGMDMGGGRSSSINLALGLGVVGIVTGLLGLSVATVGLRRRRPGADGH